MTVFGNICLGLASVGFALLLGLFAEKPGRGDGGGPAAFLVFFLAPAMFLLFSGAFCMLASSGRLDWLGLPRGLQYVGVVLSILSLMILMTGTFALQNEPADQVPWALRPFGVWVSWFVPLFLIVIGFLSVNSAGATLGVLRGAFASISALGLLVGAGLLGEVIVTAQRREMAHVEHMQERETERDRTIMEGVEKADPEKDFGSLLNQSSKFEGPPIRALALQKLLSTGDRFNALLAESLVHYYYYHGALVFLRDNDPPDPAGIAPAIPAGILEAAKQARDSIQTESTMHADDFAVDADCVLAVADKFAKYGVDYVPAVREFRAALDEPRPRDKTAMVELACRRQVDAWLASKPKAR